MRRRVFLPKIKQEVHIPKVAAVRRWTKEAVNCYELGANCARCYIDKLYFQESYRRCMMSYTMRELVRVLGTPPLYMLSDEFKKKNWLI